MRNLLLVVAGVLGLIAPTHAQNLQPDPYKSAKVPVGSFDKLDVHGPFQVLVTTGQDSTVELYGPPVLLADTIAEEDKGTLTIRFREGANWSWNPGSGMNLVVSAPRLTSIKVSGAARVEIHGLKGTAFDAKTDGSGTIVIRGMDVDRVQLATGGSGGITAEGTAREAAYAVGGSGSVDAKRLRVERAKIAVGGSGSVYADVSGNADIAVGGAGSVDVVGGATCRMPPDSPRIECR